MAATKSPENKTGVLSILAPEGLRNYESLLLSGPANALVFSRKDKVLLENRDGLFSLSLSADGAHFSPAGHMVIYELVREYLTKNKILNFETPKRYSHLYKKFKSGRARN